MDFNLAEELGHLRRLLAAGDGAAVAALLESLRDQDVAALMAEQAPAEALQLFRLLRAERRGEVFSHLGLAQQRELLALVDPAEGQQVLSALVPDDLTALLEALPREQVRSLLRLLPFRAIRRALTLLGYPEQSVGRLMTPHFVAVRPGWSIATALDHIREQSECGETVNTIFVTDDDGVLLDAIALKRFILARPEEPVARLMQGEVVSVAAADDQEEAVRLIQRYDIEALPVVDEDGRLLGIVTVDDVLDVAEEETTEDFHKMGSVGALNFSLRDADPWLLYRKRIGWLLVLILVNVFSGLAIARYEAVIETLVVLVFFLPLIIASGGNAGSQAATLMVRALATGDVRARDWLRLWGRELGVSSVLGLTMGVAVSLIGFWRGGGDIALVVAAAMVAVVVMGSMVGMLLPLLLARLRIDPAVASTPLITSIADVVGILIYFSVATALLNLA